MLNRTILLGVLAALGSAAPAAFDKRADNSTTSSSPVSASSSQSSSQSSSSSSSSYSSELEDLCDTSVIANAVPTSILGIEIDTDSITAAIVSSGSYPYCNVSLEYTHTGADDTVVVLYAFPDPENFENRYYNAGGGGYSLNSDATGGLEYGAVSGATDAGYGALDDVSFDEVNLLGNGTINWPGVHMFGYQALGELATIGKEMARTLYSVSDDDKIYTYFEGCSDGGREAMSQVQRWGDVYDGVVAGAPAFRMAQQQIHHLFSSVVEVVQDYYPVPCALDLIVNLTIDACDELDGRKDGVISRTDLCQLNLNMSSFIGETYSCAEQNSTSLGFGFSKRGLLSKRAEGSTTSYTPAQEGQLTAEDIAVAVAIYDGLHNMAGDRAYVGWAYGSDLSDGDTTYNEDTGEWEPTIVSTGGGFAARFVELLDIDNLESIDDVDYDTLVSWMNTALVRYWDTLQTTYPDLTTFQSTGGKLLHYHGEADPSIPSKSSVHYWQSVKDTMYGNLTEVGQLEALDDWYQFYLVPGAAHCGTNSLQPGPYPQSNMEIIIDWVENGNKPTGLNATVSSGDYEGEEQLLCKFPFRPVWTSDSEFECEYDEASYAAWTYSFPAFKLPVW